MNVQIQQKIIENLQHFNSFQLSEVLNFVEFIYRKQNTASPDARVIDELYGRYRDKLSSSEQFALRKQIEIKLEDEKWQRK